MIVRKATEKDMLAVAELHKVCFEGYLSTKIGCGKTCKLMGKFYKELLDGSPELFFVLTDDNDQILGFVAGDCLSNSFYLDRYIKKNYFAIARRMSWLLIKGDKKAWAKLKVRYRKQIFHIIDHRLDKVPKSDICDIISMCILPLYRGKGLSKKLIDAFSESVRQQNKRFVTLTTSKNNQRAIHFFEKCGFTKYRIINNIAYTYFCEL